MCEPTTTYGTDWLRLSIEGLRPPLLPSPDRLVEASAHTGIAGCLVTIHPPKESARERLSLNFLSVVSVTALAPKHYLRQSMSRCWKKLFRELAGRSAPMPEQDVAEFVGKRALAGVNPVSAGNLVPVGMLNPLAENAYRQVLVGLNDGDRALPVPGCCLHQSCKRRCFP
ncbi:MULTISPECIES: hypothetical protein [Rhodococcus]|jgi:hypothetical protein|uniref:hypothetical protein n=1 Tax=Rhodococcus TaxID=1827 RepID=UPI0012F699D5|nr:MULTISPECIES: hypothetical protein [Rhodococcus]QQZ18899.1 hypothetical protein GO592_35920 [Rhodococcus sp. 21391]